MKTNYYIFMLWAMCLLVLQAGTLYADSADASDVEMKAVYIYKIMQFVELPEPKWTNDKDETPRPLLVGVTDKDLLAHFRKVIGDKLVTQHKGKHRIVVNYVDVKQFEGKPGRPVLDVLFIKDTTQYDSRKLLSATVENNIMTFGETDGFLEAGGIVRFVVVDKKLRFEINTGSAKQAGIKIRSQLLRLANKIVDKKIVLLKTESS